MSTEQKKQDKDVPDNRSLVDKAKAALSPDWAIPFPEKLTDRPARLYLPAVAGSISYWVTEDGAYSAGPKDRPPVIRVGATSFDDGLIIPVGTPNRPGNDESRLELPLGLTVISGPTGLGKSLLLASLLHDMEEGGYHVVHVSTGEPMFAHDDTPIEVSTVIYGAELDVSIAQGVAVLRRMIGEWPFSPVADAATIPIMGIDSLRAAVYEAQGAAAEKGMIMSFFTGLTRLSNALAMGGVRAIAVVNPMQTSADAVEAFIDRLIASVPAAIILESLEDGDTNRAGVAEKIVSGYWTNRRNGRGKQAFNWTTGPVSDSALIALDGFEIDVPTSDEHGSQVIQRAPNL